MQIMSKNNDLLTKITIPLNAIRTFSINNVYLAYFFALDMIDMF